jgi:hypothetical protein
MNQKERTKTIQAWCRITPDIELQLKLKADEERVSTSEIIRRAVVLYLTKDITDESLLIAKMTDVQRRIDGLEKKTELSQKMSIEYLQYFFMFSQELPNDAKEVSRLAVRARQRTDVFLNSFRRRLKNMPAFLETILGDMLEEEA